MKAVVYDRYGPPEVLRIEEVGRPVPKADEVLIRVRATTVNRTDTALGARRARFPACTPPFSVLGGGSSTRSWPGRWLKLGPP